MLKCLFKHKFLTTLVLVLTFIVSASTTYSFFAGLFVFQAALKGDIAWIFIWTGTILVAIVSAVLLSIWTNYISQILYNKISFQLKVLITNKISSLKYQQILSDEYNLESLFINDLSIIQSKGFEQIQSLIKSIFSIVLMGTVLFLFNYIIGLVGLGFFALFTVISIFFNKMVVKKTLEYNQASANYIGTTKKHLEALNTLFFANKIDLFVNKLLKKPNHDIYKANVRYAKYQKSRLIFYGFALVISESILIFLSGYLYKNNQLMFGNLPGIILSVSSLANNFFRESFTLFDTTGDIKSASAIMKKINNLVKIDEQNKVVYNSDLIKSLSLINLNYQTDREEVLFKDVNYDFEINKKYLITGPSGAGKSTLTKILSNHLSTDNQMLKINDQWVDKKTFYNSIGYVDNNSIVLNDSLKNNIWLNHGNFDEKRYKEIIELLELESLDDDQILGSDEKGVSTGQQQRINLARYLYKNYKFLILDEALSNLDVQLFKKIEKYLASREDLTLLHITHHLDSIDRKLYDYELNIKDQKLNLKTI
ncbi:ABC transporter ATP-binding protein [Mycoplasma sp. E35C]|uniref:ATP-binding cassette domain-containing protein n=1 Tax=Mycoplasma sp. E35C TaxID=2801918 RepID=UPI001CA4695B|nr:ABC transporter ATP-binding protein [Mycoplasma sp. E35C]QZX49012.1 ABC transporter ATP-binding protein [Mycoplasma sp. E35C]